MWSLGPSQRPFSAWWRALNQPGDPKASLLMTSEKAVFCKNISWFLGSPLLSLLEELIAQMLKVFYFILLLKHFCCLSLYTFLPFTIFVVSLKQANVVKEIVCLSSPKYFLILRWTGHECMPSSNMVTADFHIGYVTWYLEIGFSKEPCKSINM